MLDFCIRFCLINAFRFEKWRIIGIEQTLWYFITKNQLFKANSGKILQEKTAGLFCIIKGCFILGP